MHNSEEGLTNEEGRTRSLSESSRSEGDMVLPMEPVLQSARAYKVPAVPSSENFQDSFISCDSWGELGYDKNRSLPQLPGKSLDTSSNRDEGIAPIKRKTRRRRKNRSGYSERNKSFRHGEQVKSSGNLNDGDRSAGSVSRGTALSDDRVDYFAALAPPDEISRSRSKTKESLSIMMKIRSKSLERCMPSKGMSLAATEQIPDNDWELIECSTSDSEYDSTPAPSTIVRPDARQRPRLSLVKEHLIESLAWFSFHTPKCVLEDLSSNELKHSSTDIEMSPSRLRRSPRPMDLDDDSMSSLSEDDTRSIDSRSSKRVNLGSNGGRMTESVPSKQVSQNMLKMPFTTKRECALVFVDISGFTKLSTILDVESLSKVINTYFRMLVDEVVKFGGDILKFAGDAFFAEWRVITKDEVDAETIRRLQNHPLTNLRTSFLSLNTDVESISEERSIADCVLAASQCAASIVELYSDFQLQTSRELSISFGTDQQGKCDTMLNVHCGVGCGSLVGIHVGDTLTSEDEILETRREFLFLGDPIDQVSCAEGKASEGEVFASWEAMQVLKQTCDLSDELLVIDGPACIAARKEAFFSPIVRTKHYTSIVATEEMTTAYCESLLDKCAEMDSLMLERLHRQLSLYVHHVVRDDELDVTTSQHGHGHIRNSLTTHDRHIAEAELRLVYTMFINANIDPRITHDPVKDAALFNKLQRIMQVTCRELHKFRGQLRQFIVDDKGVVLIGTFGLRGSTFANMVTNHALPATFAIHNALKNELQVENKIGATLGKAYCGVVGGVHRHEFAVMGAPVNLAARLMYSKNNNGILVDEAAQAHADSKYAFKRLSPVEAKGYNKPVIIFEPLHAVNNKKRGLTQGFIGRVRNVAELTGVAKEIIGDPNAPTVMAFIIGEPGIGKTALGLKVYDEMKLYASLHQQKIFFHRSASTESEQRVPLSAFRRIFLCGLRERCLTDGSFISSNDQSKRALSQRRIMHIERRGSLRHCAGGQTRRASLSRMPQRAPPHTKKLQRTDSSHSLSSMRSTRSGSIPYLKKLCDVCDEVKYPHEFADIVGSQWLGLEGAMPTTHVDGRVPSIEEVVGFLASAYMRLTEFADLTIIFLDDFQWIDSLTWKVIRVLCEKGKNILIMGAMRSQETQALRRMSSVAPWHNHMQARKGIMEVNIGPLELCEVRSLIARVLDCDVDIIDEQLSNDIYQKTGGIAIYVIELLESIKRNQTVEVDELSGTLKWTPDAEIEQRRIGSNNVAAIELSFLNRFDSLDRGVRRVLQTCAVLGMSFSLADVVRFHPELDDLVLELSLNAAVDELILVEDVEDDDDDDLSLWSGRGSNLDVRSLPPSGNAVDDRFFQFSHTMWRKSVLDAMLSEHKVYMHRSIAEVMEKEQDLAMESIDIGRLLTLFDHWKSCGDFGKAAPLALLVGLRLEEWDLAAQSLDLYRDALEMCYESAGDPEVGVRPRDENEVWRPASAPPATVEFILRLYIRIAKCHAHLGEHEQCATTFRDAHTIMTTSPKAAKLNAELVLPILSGLCCTAIQRHALDELENSEQLVESFLHEAIEREDVIHISRALAIKASYFASLGRFDIAVKVQEELEQVYIVEEHSSRLREEYGKDYAAQSFADSVQWYMLTGHQDMAEHQIAVVIGGLLPQFDPRDVDTSLDLLFPILLVLKAIKKARGAETILFKYAINPFHDLHGFSTRWIPLFNPIAYLFQVLGMIEDNQFDDEVLEQIKMWVLDPEKGIFDSDLQYIGYAMIGELCSLLARIKCHNTDDFLSLMERGRIVLTRVVFASGNDKSDTFMVQQARLALDDINLMDDDLDDEYAEDASGEVTHLQATLRNYDPPDDEYAEEASGEVTRLQATLRNYDPPDDEFAEEASGEVTRLQATLRNCDPPDDEYAEEASGEVTRLQATLRNYDPPDDEFAEEASGEVTRLQATLRNYDPPDDEYAEEASGEVTRLQATLRNYDPPDDEYAEETSDEVTRLQATLLNHVPPVPVSNGNAPSTSLLEGIVSESATPSPGLAAGDSNQRMAGNKCCSLL